MTQSQAWTRWTEAEARAALAEFGRSGESELAFARRHGISRQRLRYWRKRLGQSAGNAAFVAVDLPAVRTGGDEIAIRVGDVAVCVREDLDVEHLARIVEALSRRTRGC